MPILASPPKRVSWVLTISAPDHDHVEPHRTISAALAAANRDHGSPLTWNEQESTTPTLAAQTKTAVYTVYAFLS